MRVKTSYKRTEREEDKEREIERKKNSLNTYSMYSEPSLGRPTPFNPVKNKCVFVTGTDN